MQYTICNVKYVIICIFTHSLALRTAQHCIRDKMELIDIEEETIDAEILDAMAVNMSHFKVGIILSLSLSRTLSLSLTLIPTPYLCMFMCMRMCMCV